MILAIQNPSLSQKGIISLLWTEHYACFLFYWLLLDLLRNNYYLGPARPQAVTYLALLSPTSSHPAWVSNIKSPCTVVFLSGCLFSCISVPCCLLNCFFLPGRNVKLPPPIAKHYSLQPKLLTRFRPVNVYDFILSNFLYLQSFLFSDFFLFNLLRFKMIIYQVVYSILWHIKSYKSLNSVKNLLSLRPWHRSLIL